MFFPESLYELSQRDQQVTWLDPLLFFRSENIASSTVSFNYDVPMDRALILQHILLSGIPGVTQNVAQQRVQLHRGAESSKFIWNMTPLAAGVRALSTWTGSVLVPGGWTIQQAIDFSSGVNPNQADFSLLGILIPIANIQRI